MLNQGIIESESLGYWYFRLNGFLTIPNFVVHPEWGNDQRTDVDILGVRFPYRRELFPNTMTDDRIFSELRGRPYILIAEVKKGLCSLNGAWTNPERQNIERLLRAVGCFNDGTLPSVIRSLHENGVHEDDSYRVSLVLVGSQRNSELLARFEHVPQLIWSDILKFIHERFSRYRNQKSSHNQWDATGQRLWSHFEQSQGSQETFTTSVLSELV